MVSTNDLILTGGLLLGVLYLKKRSDQVSTVAPTFDYQPIQEINLQRLTQFESRIGQLKDIRSQILEYERGQTEGYISQIKTEIEIAQSEASAAQRYLAQPFYALGRTASRAVSSARGDLEAAYRFLKSGDPSQQLQAGQIGTAIARQQAAEKLQLALGFIDVGEAEIAALQKRQAELEQIV